MVNVTDYIKVFNTMTDDECDYVMHCAENNSHVTNFYRSLVGDADQGDYKPSIIDGRNNTQCYVIPQTPLDIFLYEKVAESYQLWLAAIDPYMRQVWNTQFRNIVDSGYQINKYEQDQFYDFHVDLTQNRDIDRVLSIVLYLNDDYEGGELEFPFMTHKPKRGDAILFPSTWLYPHRAAPVKSGTKYSVVTWFNNTTGSVPTVSE
jgi:hypothetical protein